jgi:hypothetical protein
MNGNTRLPYPLLDQLEVLGEENLIFYGKAEPRTYGVLTVTCNVDIDVSKVWGFDEKGASERRSQNQDSTHPIHANVRKRGALSITHDASNCVPYNVTRAGFAKKNNVTHTPVPNRARPQSDGERQPNAASGDLAAWIPWLENLCAYRKFNSDPDVVIV